MAVTTSTFSAMLETYVPDRMLTEEQKRHSYFWNKVKKDPTWKGGTYRVDYEGGENNSIQFENLVASTDVGEATAVAGTVTTYPEMWGTLLFNEKDLDRHSDLKQSVLQILPGKLEQFMKRFAQVVNVALLRDGAISALTSDGANGSIIVDKPQLHTIGEKIEIDDDNSAVASAYVTAIDMATKTLTIKDARSSGSNVNASAYTVAQNAKVYPPNGVASGFTGLGNQLLSATNGGSSALFGTTKTTHPFLQSQQHDGATINAANILEKLFDFYFDTLDLGKGNPTELLMSMKNLKNCLKSEQANRLYATSDKKAGYGFRSVTLIGNEGELTLTGVRDMPDSRIYILDWDGLIFAGYKFFEKKRHQNNELFFMTRATTGIQYLVDVKFYGNLICKYPSHQGIVHSISY